jgi:hypothetical protein
MSYLLCLPQIEGLDIVAVNEEKEGLLIIAKSRCREQACRIVDNSAVGFIVIINGVLRIYLHKV